MLKRKKQNQQQQQLQQPQLPQREETGDEEDGSRIGEDPGKSANSCRSERDVKGRKGAEEEAPAEGVRAHSLARVWRASPGWSPERGIPLLERSTLVRPLNLPVEGREGVDRELVCAAAELREVAGCQ